jgi:hypothetical protein
VVQSVQDKEVIYFRPEMDSYILDSDSLTCLDELKSLSLHYSVVAPAITPATNSDVKSAAPSSSSLLGMDS